MPVTVISAGANPNSKQWECEWGAERVDGKRGGGARRESGREGGVGRLNATTRGAAWHVAGKGGEE